MGNAVQSPSESARDKTYTVRALQETFGVSRNTLLYYEKAGVVTPEVDSRNGYRTYTNDDVFRLLESATMRNMGFTLDESQALLSDPGLGAADCLGRCLELSCRVRGWHEAAERTLEDVRAIARGEDDACAVRLVRAPRWLLFLTDAEKGYENFSADETLDALLRNYPVSCPAILIGDDFYSHDHIRPRWGRAVESGRMDLLADPGSMRSPDVELGGCPCVTLPYVARCVDVPGFDPGYEVRDRVRMFVKSHGLCVDEDNRAFAVNAFPVHGSFFARLYVPVRGSSIRGKIAIRGVSLAE
jgi:DNA-binding transcriptional MerR regulator